MHFIICRNIAIVAVGTMTAIFLFADVVYFDARINVSTIFIANFAMILQCTIYVA